MATRSRKWTHRLVAFSCDLNASLRKVAQIEPQTALERLEQQQPTVWIDARTETEQNVSTIQGAMTAEDAIEKIDSLRSDPQTLVIVYCTAGFRSANFVSKLKRLGVSATNLRGGLFGWCEIDGPLVDHEGNETRKVHTYGRYARFVPDTYDAVP